MSYGLRTWVRVKVRVGVRAAVFGRLLLLHFNLQLFCAFLLKRYNLQPHASPLMWNQLFVQLWVSSFNYPKLALSLMGIV